MSILFKKNHKNNTTNDLIELKSKESLIEVKETNKVIIIFFILTSTLIVSTFINFGLSFLSWKLATKEKIYVERQGQTEIAEEKDPYYRSDRVIKQTVLNWLYLTWEWDYSIPGSRLPDQGVKVKTGKNNYFIVPTRVYSGSYLLEIGFREQFLKEISTIIPQSFYNGRLSSNIKVYHVGNPVRIDKNLYKIKVIITRTDRGETSELGETQINRTIYLQSIEPDRLIMGNNEPSNFRKELARMLKNGLIIYKVTPY
jgi:hypothetical protein